MIETVTKVVPSTPTETVEHSAHAELPPARQPASTAILPPAVSSSSSYEHSSQSSPQTAASSAGTPSVVEKLYEGAANAFTWAKDKCVGAACSVRDHVADLKNVRSFDDLTTWAKNFASDAWNGITSTISEATTGVKRFYRELTETARISPPESAAQSLGAVIERAAVAAAEKKEREKVVRQEEADARAKLRHTSAYHHGMKEKLLYAIECAPKFIDRETLQSIRLAILTNRIPPERMPEVRRFLQQISDEEQSSKTRSGAA